MFELLDSNLYELIHANNFKGLHESFVRIFAIQILNSLNFLARMNVVHCDIKPENIVLKMWGKSGVKMIDFGTSCYEGIFIPITRTTKLYLHPIQILSGTRNHLPQILYQGH